MTSHLSSSMPESSYPKSVLYLTYSVSLADGIELTAESKAIIKIAEYENIAENVFQKFSKDTKYLSPDEMNKIGMEAIRNCGRNERLRIYGWIYKIMEVDGNVDVREAKFLMDAMKISNIELDEVIQTSKALPRL